MPNKPKSNNTALAKAPQSESTVPEYLRKAPKTAAAGLENVEQRDMTLPRLALAQALTPQLSKSDPKYIHNLQPGMYFNTITGYVYGETVKVVPLLMYKTRIRFNPIEVGGGIRCQAQDARHGVGDPGGDCEVCEFARFAPDAKRPECDLFYNYAALAFADEAPLDPSAILVVSLKSTAIKVAKTWNSLMRLRNTDAFAGVYEFTSAEVKRDNQRWFTPVVKGAGFVSEEQYKLAQAMYQMVKEAQQAGKLKVDDEENAIDEEPGSKAPF